MKRYLAMGKHIKILSIIFTLGIILEFTLTGVLSVAQGKEPGDIAEDQSSSNMLGKLFFQPTPTPTATPTPMPTPTPAFGEPVRIDVPSISISTQVENIGVDENNQMGVPTNPDHVGWYALGTRIGWQGKAVFTGHYDTARGAPAIFYSLSQIPLGAEIILTDEQGRTMVFEVDRSESKPVGAWTIDEVFGPTDERRIVLITCSGWWNPQQRSYSHRHMVFAKLRGLY